MKTYIFYDETNATPNQPYTISHWTAEQFTDWQYGRNENYRFGDALISGGDIHCVARTRRIWPGSEYLSVITQRVSVWMAEQERKAKRKRGKRPKGIADGKNAD